MGSHRHQRNFIALAHKCDPLQHGRGGGELWALPRRLPVITQRRVRPPPAREGGGGAEATASHSSPSLRRRQAECRARPKGS